MICCEGLFRLYILICFVGNAEFLRCTDENDIGTTLPRASIDVERNESFEIMCLLDRTLESVAQYDSSALYFTNESTEKGKETVFVVPRSKYRVINDSAVVLRESLDWPVSYLYYCRLNASSNHELGVCSNIINVGSPPLPLENFTCTVINWEYLVCTWHSPYNAIRTIYEVMYVASNYYRRKCTSPDNERFLSEPRSFSCEVPQNVFRPSHEIFYVEVSASNALANSSFAAYQFETFSVIRPNAPVLNVLNVGAHWVSINASLQHPLITFPRPVYFEVQLRSAHDWEIVTIDEPFISPTPDPIQVTVSRQIKIQLDHLFSYTTYEVRVRIRCSNSSEVYVWSEYSVAHFVTLPSPPSRPPAVDQSSFEIISSSAASGLRDVRLFWMPIDERFQNGPHFHYCFRNESNLMPITATQRTNTSALLKNLSFESVRLSVAACNALGNSSWSTLVIPAHSNHVKHPYSINVFQLSDRRYRVTWNHRLPGNEPISYTVFWCRRDRVVRSLCGRMLGWRQIRVVNATEMSSLSADFNVSIADADPLVAVAASQVAAAAEITETSSGVHWASCYVPRHSVPGQPHSLVAQTVLSNSVYVVFSRDCVTNALASHYKVLVCSVDSDSRSDSCSDIGRTRVDVVNNTSEAGVLVSNLNVNSSYLLRVAAVYNGNAGKFSDWLPVDTTAVVSASVTNGKTIAALVGGLLTTLTCVSLAVWTFRRLKRQWAKLKAVKVNLPSGLDNFERSPLFNPSTTNGVSFMRSTCDDSQLSQVSPSQHEKITSESRSNVTAMKDDDEDEESCGLPDLMALKTFTPITSVASSRASFRSSPDVIGSCAPQSTSPLSPATSSPYCPCPPLYVHGTSLKTDSGIEAVQSSTANYDTGYSSHGMPTDSPPFVDDCITSLSLYTDDQGEHGELAEKANSQLDNGLILNDETETQCHSYGNVCNTAENVDCYEAQSASHRAAVPVAPGTHSICAVGITDGGVISNNGCVNVTFDGPSFAPSVKYSPYVDAAAVRALMMLALSNHSAENAQSRTSSGRHDHDQDDQLDNTNCSS